MIPHPENSNVLYFTWGMSYANIGTYIYRFDAESGIITWSHNNYNQITALAFSPASSSVLYLGLDSVEFDEF
jgi:hypothetical protein